VVEAESLVHEVLSGEGVVVMDSFGSVEKSSLQVCFSVFNLSGVFTETVEDILNMGVIKGGESAFDGMGGHIFFGYTKRFLVRG